MFTNKLFNYKSKLYCGNNYQTHVGPNAIPTCKFKFVDTMNPGWLREMDGENSEEDRRLPTNSVESTGQNSYHSVKKVSFSFILTIHYHQ